MREEHRQEDAPPAARRSDPVEQLRGARAPRRKRADFSSSQSARYTGSIASAIQSASQAAKSASGTCARAASPKLIERFFRAELWPAAPAWRDLPLHRHAKSANDTR
jgi:hypothetical protein